MEYPRPLRIAFARIAELPAVFAAIDRSLTSGWRRATELEAPWGPAVKEIQSCYQCEAQGTRPAVSLIVAWSDADFLSVGHVWPAGECFSRDCPVALWNIAVADFHHRCLSRIDTETMDRLGLKIGMWSSEVCVEELMSPRAFALLKPMADKDTFWLGQEQWEEFVRLLGLERHRLTPAILKAWLIEQGWYAPLANERADELALALSDD